MRELKLLNQDEYNIAKEYVNKLPDVSPCYNCPLRNGSCCGCDKAKEYKAMVDYLDENNVLELVVLMRQEKRLQKEIEEKQQKLEICKEKISHYIVTDEV